MPCGPKYCWRRKKLLKNKAAPKAANGGFNFNPNIRKVNMQYIEIVSRGKNLSIKESGKPVTSLRLLARYRKIGQS